MSILFLSFTDSFGQSSITQQRIRILKISGKAKFRKPKSNSWYSLTTKTMILNGWDIKTPDNTIVNLSMEPSITVTIRKNSLLRLDKLLKNQEKKALRMVMEMQAGSIDIDMPKQLGYKLLFTFKTPSATIYLRNAKLKISVEGNNTIVDILRGSAKIKHNETDLKSITYSNSRARINQFETGVYITKISDKNKIVKKEKPPEVSVAILSIHSRTSSKEDLEPVADFVAEEIENNSNTEVLFLDDVRTLLQAEGVENLLNCITDSCISKIGSYIGVDMVVIGKLGKLGNKYVFNLKMVDVLRDRTISRVSATVNDDVGLILNEIPDMIGNLVTKKAYHGSNQTPNKSNNPMSQKKSNTAIRTSDMEWIFPGECAIGSEMIEGDMDEQPQHKVSLNGFYIDKYEVTKKDFEEVMGYNPSAFKGCVLCPVENVSWQEAFDYCKKSNKRLPTEAEWEYACRAGTKTTFHYGNTLSSINANFNGKKPHGGAPVGIARNKPIPVATFKPNTWHLFDMHGNVSEWCNDTYDPAYYGNSPDENPQGGNRGKFKVARGGSWRDEGKTLRSANRIAYNPTMRLSTIGFRCAKNK